MVEKGSKVLKEEVVTRENKIYKPTQRLRGCTFKKKAPKAIKEIRKFTQKAMGTTDVGVEQQHMELWHSKCSKKNPCPHCTQEKRR